jgi:hypothetical protein
MFIITRKYLTKIFLTIQMYAISKYSFVLNLLTKLLMNVCLCVKSVVLLKDKTPSVCFKLSKDGFCIIYILKLTFSLKIFYLKFIILHL